MSKKKSNWLLKSYKNTEFLNSPPARLIRVMAEMIEPDVRCREYGIHGTVVFFGSARTLSSKDAKKNLRRAADALKRSEKPTKILKQKHNEAERDLEMSRYYDDAVSLSGKLALYFKENAKDLVISTGGGPGIMEAANLGAKKAGAESMGLNISLPMEQAPNLYQTRDLAFEFHYFFVRKFWFVSLAKAIIVFPGGFGTMDELFEILTLTQTGKSRKNIPVILYGKDYWDDIVNFDNLVKWRMISKEDMRLFSVVNSVEEAFYKLKKVL